MWISEVVWNGDAVSRDGAVWRGEALWSENFSRVKAKRQIERPDPVTNRRWDEKPLTGGKLSNMIHSSILKRTCDPVINQKLLCEIPVAVG